MNTPGSVGLKENLPRQRQWLRRFLVVAGFLAVVLLALLGFRGKQPSAPSPPEVPGEAVSTTDPEIKSAVESARALVLREPNSGNAWGNLGQVLQIHNFLTPAIECYSEAERLDAGNADWPYLKATIILVGREPADAIPLLRRSAQLGGYDQLARLRLSEVLLDQGRYEEAAGELRLVLAAYPASPRAHFRMARVAVAQQDWKTCLRHLEAMGDSPFARKQACSLRLIAYKALGDDMAASREQALLGQLKDDPPWPDAISDKLGRFLVGQVARLRQAQQMIMQGDAPGCINLLTRTVCDYPESEATWTALGKALASVGDLPAAEDVLLKSAELSPESADVWATLGYVRLKNKKPLEALECYRVVLRLKPTDADAHFGVGECLDASGNRSGASEAYRQALLYRPEFREARERLGKLQK